MIKSVKIETDNGNTITLSDENGVGPDLLKLAIGVLKKEIDAAKVTSGGEIETK